MRALRAHACEEIEFIGVGGEQMLTEQLHACAPIDRLAVNGFRDPILRLPELIKLLWRLIREISEAHVDVFVGIDFNVFNFLLEAGLRRRGIKTVHYVSPSVYAWRTGRTKRVAKSADLLLCLYPFEPKFYEQTSVDAQFIGHPLADEIDLQAGSENARLQARSGLGVDAQATVLAMLPGSRNSEVDLMIDDFLAAAHQFVGDHAHAHIVVPCLRSTIKTRVTQALLKYPDLPVTLYVGNARKALVACNIALVKSGTSTLETMLLHRPMVVSYRLGWFTYQLAKRVVRTPFVALPNILAGKQLVPELLQDAATGVALATALRDELRLSNTHPNYLSVFAALHAQLRQGADAKAAIAVLGLASEK